MAPSYASGIGSEAADRRDDRREPRTHRRASFRDREALVVAPPGHALRPTPSSTRRSTALARGLLARGARSRRPGRHLGAELRRVGARAVRDREGRRRSSSTSTPPTGRTSSPTRSTSPAAGCWSAAPAFKTIDYVAMVDEVRGDLPGARAASSSSARRDWDDAARRGRRHRRRGAARPRRGPALRRPDQHPVHERHHRLPQGRHAQPPQHPQQRRSSSASCCGYTEARPRLHPGAASTTASAWSWATSAASPTARRWSSPRPAFEPGRDARGGPGRALHVALRRADDVHRRARAPGLRRVRPVDACAPGSWPARRARSRS